MFSLPSFRVCYQVDGILLTRSFISVVIKFLGFKDKSELAFEDNVKHSFFIYPDEMVRFVKNPLSYVSPWVDIDSRRTRAANAHSTPSLNQCWRKRRSGSYWRSLDVTRPTSSALCFLKYVLIFLVLCRGFSETNDGSQAEKVERTSRVHASTTSS